MDCFVRGIAVDWRRVELAAADQALCQVAEKLTKTGHLTEADITAIRNHGLSDAAIHDAVQVIGYFNYINRVANGLGVEPEGFVKAWEKED